MNGNIKRILEQVGGHGTQALMHPDDVVKFAHMLIDESANYLYGAMEVHNQRDQDYLNLAADKLKQYFGVN